MNPKSMNFLIYLGCVLMVLGGVGNLVFFHLARNAKAEQDRASQHWVDIPIDPAVKVEAGDTFKLVFDGTEKENAPGVTYSAAPPRSIPGANVTTMRVFLNGPAAARVGLYLVNKDESKVVRVGTATVPAIDPIPAKN